jgi:predicted RNase H-like HicB family nuclease
MCEVEKQLCNGLHPDAADHIFLTMLKIECEQEVDGRWIAEIPALPGVMVFDDSEVEACNKAQVLALRVIADRVENGEALPGEIAGVFEAA